jgi:hypothetical protein
MADEDLLDVITTSFIESAGDNGFNGVVASALLKYQSDPRRLRGELSALIQRDKITAIFSRLALNMHIKRLPDASTKTQLELLDVEPLERFCLYPTASAVKEHSDLTAWYDRPFSKALLLAEPQLAFRAFELGSLERYVADPRYSVRFNDYAGWMSISDDFFGDVMYPERDKVSLQSFGIGFDSQHNPYVVVFLRYLAGLSAEHQQYWNSYLAHGDIRLSEPYFRSSIEGQFWENHSVRHAIIAEMHLIRKLARAIWGSSPFGETAEGEVPIGLTSFLRPTAENFNRFVMALDKLLSESIEVKFFEGKVALEIEKIRPDEKIIVQKKGTLTLLEDWLLQEITWDDPKAFRDVVIRPLREVRRLRQKPAHAFTSDAFSMEYREKRKRLLWDVFSSLSSIRVTFAKHPQAGHVEIPDWLDRTDFDVF